MLIEDPPKKPLRTLGLAMVFLGAATAIISAIIGLQATDTAAQPLQTSSAVCEPIPDVLGSADQSVRGSTDAVPWNVFNQQMSLLPLGMRAVDAPGVPGNRALQFDIRRAGRFAHDVGVSMLNTRPIAQGDLIEMRVWLKAQSSGNASGPVMVEVRFQNNEPGFRRFLNEQVELSNQFKEYVFTAPAPKNYCADEFNAAIHLATGKQKIDVGPGTIKVVGASNL
jgi:hypothetical protein